jgi:two-component system, chemotaxis family, chemotaxis protein CheY
MSHTISLAEIAAMVVEPSAMQAKVMLAALQQAGVGMVKHTTHGAEAMAWLQAHPQTLVVSAFHLPDMTGAELIAQMRATPSLLTTPFILVSSETRFSMLDPIRQSGVSGILPKPFSPDQLRAALNATLDLLNLDESLEDAGFNPEILRVLVVDDSAIARKFIRRVLSNLGVQHFFEAENGRIAAEMLADTAVDLVVTDYNMPEMDGQALIEHIRTQSWQKSVPVLMVSSETNSGRLAAVEELGVVGMCDKPFEPAVVRSLLSRLLATG